jgi:hypothetical protein
VTISFRCATDVARSSSDASGSGGKKEASAREETSEAKSVGVTSETNQGISFGLNSR